MNEPCAEPGRCASGRHCPRFDRLPRRGLGFTLIELMIVLVVVSVVVGMVVVSLTPNPRRDLQEDAQRLALLLSLAQDEAQIRGGTIRLESSATQYRFLIYKERKWRVIEDDQDLRAREWREPTKVVVERSDGLRTLEFGRDMVEPPFRIRLLRGMDEVEIVANGLGSFEVPRD